MKPVIAFFFFLISSFGLFAQDLKEPSDVIFLKNGGHLTGKIIIYEQGEELLFETKDGERVRVSDGEIQRIVQGVSTDEIEDTIEENKIALIPIEAKTSGLYNVTMLSFAVGKGNSNALALGAGLSTVIGYQIKPYLGIGAGIGLDNYARRGETLYPIFAEVRGFIPFKNKPHSYYVAVAGGYGLAFKRESIGVKEANGGYMFHPSLGFRTATREGVDVNIDIGAKWQKAEFQHDLFNGDIRVRDLVFQRLTVRVGLSLWK